MWVQMRLLLLPLPVPLSVLVPWTRTEEIARSRAKDSFP